MLNVAVPIIGASLTAATLTAAVWLTVVVPSETVYVIVAVPLKLASGVNVQLGPVPDIVP